MDDQMPDYKCITCGWEGFKKSQSSMRLYPYET